MEDFILEHGGIIVSGIIALISLGIIAQIIWATGEMTMIAFDQILGGN